jgi:hypothetical protein
MMDKQEKLHALRVDFIELNKQYTRRVKDGDAFMNLKSLNTRICEIVVEIQSLEQDLLIT